jgi:GAF domain-containing protein
VSVADPLALAVLHEVLVALGRGADRDTVLHLVAEKACLLTGCASAAVALLEADREYVSFAAVAGPDAAASELLGTRVHTADTVAGLTARTGEPFLAFRPRPAGKHPDAAPTNGVPPALPPAYVESAAVVPIFDDGRPVGSLAALNKGGGVPFDGGDLMGLQTLAAAAAVAIASGRLRSEGHRRQRELASLYEAVRQVSGQLSGQEVLRTVVEQVSAHVETSAVAIFLLNDERTHLYVAEDDGLTDEDREVTLSADAGLGALTLTASQPLLLTFEDEDDFGGGDTADSVRTGHPPAQHANDSHLIGSLFPSGGGAASSARSGIAAPIRSGDTVHGVVVALSGQPPGAYGAAETNLLSALAAQAAVAIENAFLYEDATRRAEEAATLYELSQAVTSTLSLPEVLDRVAEAVLSLLAVDKFALFLQERRSGRLRLVVSRGLAEGAEGRLNPEIGQGIPGWVLEFETPTAVRDVAADHRNASAPLHTEGVISMTAMPLQVGAATIGVLCALSARRRLFTVAEMELLYTIANQAAVAIENARVYAAVRHKSLELRRYFHRVARALGSSQDPGEVPELIASLTMEVMGADRCAVYSVEEVDGTLRLTPAARVGYRGPASVPVVPTTDSPTFWVARKARPLAVADLGEDARFAEAHEQRPTRGRAAASYLGVPLKDGERVVGVLEVYTRSPRPWRGDEVRLLLAFASQAAVAFRNARLARDRGRSERALRLTQQLLAMATSSTTPLDPAELLNVLAVGLDGPVALLRRPSDSGAWEVVLHRGMDVAWDEDALGAAEAAYGRSGVTAVAAQRGSGNDQADRLYCRSVLEAAVSLLEGGR